MESTAGVVTPARIVVGTAGHIDHGKTTLVRALTGIETDRLPEEKARGITIELGFAHLEVAGRVLGVVDVPGHERFVRAMVAGATGVDLVLLVVAADEGVMPQTREHFDICRMLGIKAGLVALTKCDLVEADWLAMVTADVRELIAGSFLEGAALVPCSARTGVGLDDLRRELAALSRPVAARGADGPARLPIDRVFSLKGQGTVVTGTLASGTFAEGEAVTVLPHGAEGKVRALGVHGQVRTQVQAGERVAVNLLGVDRSRIGRGEILAHRDEVASSAIVDVELALLEVAPRSITRRSKVLVHALTAQVGATVLPLEGDTIEPGRRGLAQLRLEAPLALLPGDRFIVRGFQVLPGHGTTVGGGRVVRVLAPKVRGDRAEAAAMARAMASATTDARIALEIDAAGTQGIDRAGLRARTGNSARQIERALADLLSRRAASVFNRETGAVVGARALDALKDGVLAAVDRFHADEPLRPGLAREELRTRLGRGVDARLADLVVAELVRGGILTVERELVRRASFSAQAAEQGLDDLVGRVARIYADAGLAPPWSNELPARLGAPPKSVEDALTVLGRRGQLVRVKAELYFDRGALGELRNRLVAHLDRAGQISAQEWKELTGLTRKYAIPLAEHFDAEKVTLRVGDLRKLRVRPPA